MMNLHGGNSIKGRLDSRSRWEHCCPILRKTATMPGSLYPGFYKKSVPVVRQQGIEFDDSEKRTASDVFQLIKDITTGSKRSRLNFESNPPADTDEAIERIITDPDFHDILLEYPNMRHSILSSISL
jgi:hypothetical protein